MCACVFVCVWYTPHVCNVYSFWCMKSFRLTAIIYNTSTKH